MPRPVLGPVAKGTNPGVLRGVYRGLSCWIRPCYVARALMPACLFEIRSAAVRVVRVAVTTVLLAAAAFLGGCKTIPEGKSSVNELQFRGTDKIDEGDIEDKIATTETSKFLLLFRGILFEYSLFDRFVLQRDLARVEAFYRSKGYYDVHARAGRVHTIDDKHVRVEIIVEEGEAVMVREVHVDGLDGLPADVVTAAQKAAAEGLLVNKPFEEETFKKTEGLVRRALTDRGYAYAKVKSDAAVDLVKHKTDIVLSVHAGPTCTFGDITIEGLGELPDKGIRRTIDIKPGSKYSEQAIEDAQQALLDLGVLAGVEITPNVPGGANGAESKKPAKDPKDSKDPAVASGDKKEEEEESPGQTGPADGPPVVPLRVKLEPARLKTLRLGGGVEFDALKTDVHGIIGWENKNFFGGLRSFSVQFRPGVVLYPLRVNNFVAPSNFFPEERLRIEFKQPGFPEARTNFFERPEFNVFPVLVNPDPPPDQPVIGYAEARNSIGLERTIWKFYAGLSHNLQVEAPFGYLHGADPTLSLIVISYPELFTAFDFRDDKVHTHKGIYLANTLQVAGFGGTATDFKLQPEIRTYVPISKKITWASRASVGLLFASNYGTAVQKSKYQVCDPANPTAETCADPNESAKDRTRDYQITYFRGFFSGGPNSNRGYTVRGVGPYDYVPFLTPENALQNTNDKCGNACKSPTGGFTLWEASTELRFAVTGPLSVATFCDASDVSPREANFQFNSPHLSCGAGGRYDTPAGPIRLDIGYRINGLQIAASRANEEREPDTLVSGIPIAISIGIGEAY